MSPLLPPSRPLRIVQYPGEIGKGRLDSLEQLIVVVPPKASAALLRSVPGGNQIQTFWKRNAKGKRSRIVTTVLGDSPDTRIVAAQADPSASAFTRLTRARKVVGEALKSNPASLGLVVAGFDSADEYRLVEGVVAAILAAASPGPKFKSSPDPRPRLRKLMLLGMGKRLDLKETRAAAEGNDLARWLSSLPANVLDPGGYRRAVTTLARRHGWQMRFFGQSKLEQLGAGAFLAVTQASSKRDAGIIHLRYRPSSARARPRVSLVGKGICFDTGGANLKPHRSMYDMHGDMQGSAVALGTFLALTLTKTRYPVDCWLAVAENSIGPSAYKPQDVVTAANGKTIQVVHTDAEGRMVLADTLALASRDKPRLIIDYATLTGACVVALTEVYSGVFSNREDLGATLIEAGRQSGERVWPFPMDEDYDEFLRSDVADIKQCALKNDGDHILAARFLSRFVAGDISWIHVDLSASQHEGGLAHVPSTMTGFGVRFTLELLRRQGILDRPAPR